MCTITLPPQLELRSSKACAEGVLHLSCDREAGVLPSHHRLAPRASLLQRRQGAFAAAPAVNCALAKEEVSALNPQFTCSRITNRFIVQEALGQGSAAVVYRARTRADDREVALKVVRAHDEELLRTARQEYELLRSLEHPNVVRALDFLTYSMGAVLVLELFDGTNLASAVRAAAGGRITEDAARGLIRQLLAAVAHLHAHDVIHRDVKGENVLVSRGLQDLRLADFNVAQRVLEGGELTMTGTEEYQPPEVLLGEPPARASDVWASGLCLHLTLVGALPSRPPACPSRSSLGRAILARGVPLHGPKWAQVSAPCTEALGWCLEVDLARRAHAAEVLEGHWLRACGGAGAPEAQRGALN